MKIIRTKPFPCSTVPRRAFSLVITLTLMSFMVVLSIGMVALLRVESNVSVAQVGAIEARQNALLSLQAALGEIQSAAGADQRSVARAETMIQHDRVGGPSSVFPSSVNTSTDTRSLWVGVGHSDAAENVGIQPQPVVWLVSGLDRSQSSANQLTTSFVNPVDLVTVRTTPAITSPAALTLRAGKVPVTGANNSLEGRIAWIADDETQKAKLAPTSIAVRNSTPAALLAFQRTVLPGFFDLSNTTGIAAAFQDFFNAFRPGDLIINNAANAPIINERFFDYTVSGFGVLTNTREGGLKRDLTAAYERIAIFDNLFPNQSAPYAAGADNTYLAIDSGRLALTPDLRTAGYIHHGIFRDYYRLKDRLGAGNSLPISVVNKRLIDNNAIQAMRQGTLGPHQINNLDHPYGSFTAWTGSGLASVGGAHNPITPVLAFMQQNAWIQAIQDRADEHPHFTNFTQLWTGVYNPYNVTLQIATSGAGPMFRGYPMPRIFLYNGDTGAFATHQNSPGDNWNGRMLRDARWIYTRETVSIAPGRTQIFGFSDDVDVLQTEGSRAHTFSKNVADSVQRASIRERRLTSETGEDFPVDMLVEMTFLNTGSNINTDWNGPSMAWGLPAEQGSSTPQTHPGHEIAQVFYLPFSTDLITNAVDNVEGQNVNKALRPPSSRFANGQTPGVQFYRQDIPWNTARMSSVDEAVYEFKLRTTTASTSRGQLRPLIDSNIRAIWNNPKWDSDLGLNAIATHTLSTNKFDDLEPAEPDNLGQPEGNEAFLSYGNSLDVQGSQQVILFDVPREPLVSIGQLQHAAAGRFSYEPTYIVGNSYANIRIPLDSWRRTNATDTYSAQHAGMFAIPGTFTLYDASYLVNEALFDGYTFTTIPQESTQAQLDQFLSLTRLLQNPRYIPYVPAGLSFDQGTLTAATAARTNAAFVLADGAFNVNSTSVEAWEVFLSGTRGLPYRRMNNAGVVTGFTPVGGVRFPRVQTILGQPWQTSPNNEAWFGFRELTTAEVRALAVEIVELIKERGPFYSLSEFINRQLVNNEQGRAGLLQTALDNVINSTIPASFEGPADRGRFNRISAGSTQGAGFPTQLLQGDILQSLAPYMQTRSDTFTIRTYGESISPTTGEVLSRAWGEAVVQRIPDPVMPNGTVAGIADVANPISPFGRQFIIISFRWLDEEEV